MKRLLFFTFTFMVINSLCRAVERNLLEKRATLEQVKNALIMDQKWVPLPGYYDREGWTNY